MSARIGIDEALLALAREAGVDAQWTDAFGVRHQVDYEILRRVLEALELPCGSPAQIVQSRRSLASRARQTSRRMVIVQVDEAPVFTQTGALAYRLTLEGGGQRSGLAVHVGDGLVRIAPIDRHGYHNLLIGTRSEERRVGKECVRTGRSRW